MADLPEFAAIETGDQHPHRARSERLTRGRLVSTTGDDWFTTAPSPPADLATYGSLAFADAYPYHLRRLRAERRVSYVAGADFAEMLPPDVPEASEAAFIDGFPHRAAARFMAQARRASGVFDDESTQAFLEFPQFTALQFVDGHPYRAIAERQAAGRRVSACFDPNRLYDWSWLSFYCDRLDYRRAAQRQAAGRRVSASELALLIAPTPGAPTSVGRVVSFR